jgi:adenosylhomocysteine nucleosidase
LPADPTKSLAVLGGVSVLFLMATEYEYGPHLRQRISPLMTGVGPVEAAAAVAAALGSLDRANKLPGLIVLLGSAGSRTLEHAKVYQASHVSYRDMDCSPLGFEKGVTPFIEQPAVIPIPLQIPGVPEASVSTGAQIVAGEMYQAIPADMVDMESFAVMRAGAYFGVPSIILRGISDGRGELSKFEHWTEYLHVVDEHLAAAVDRLFAFALDGGLKKHLA